MRLLTLILLLGLLSCSHSNKKNSIENDNSDVLTLESLSRYSLERLSALKVRSELSELIKSCHQGDNETALERLSSKISKYRNNPVYWRAIATCYLNEGVFDKAVFFHNIALSKVKASHEKARIYNNLAVINMKLGHKLQSLEQFKVAAKLAPKSKTIQYNLSFIYTKYNQFNKAKMILTSLLNQNSKDPALNFLMALNLTYQGKHRQALKFYKRIPGNKLKDEVIAINFSYALHKTGHISESLRVFNNRTPSSEYKMKSFARQVGRLINSKS